MPTPAERQALLFLAAVAVIGGGVQAVGTRGLARDVAGAEQGPAPSTDLATRALDAQIAAVDSARRRGLVWRPCWVPARLPRGRVAAWRPHSTP